MTHHESTDLISVIVADHRDVDNAFSELETGTGTPEHRRQLVDHVIAELVRHSVAEEMWMYPAARDALPDGDEIAEHEIEEHAEAEKIMDQLYGLEPDDARFDGLLEKLISAIRHHIEDEERDLLPRLREACSQDQLDDLGRKVLNAKKVAPTRPHPAAPDRPPLNRVLAPGAGLVDRMRDALSGRKV
jgi:hemerythrin superfamily protein